MSRRTGPSGIPPGPLQEARRGGGGPTTLREFARDRVGRFALAAWGLCAIALIGLLVFGLGVGVVAWWGLAALPRLLVAGLAVAVAFVAWGVARWILAAPDA
jgi:hypothetical protein